jgi:hypothetical protein
MTAIQCKARSSVVADDQKGSGAILIMMMMIMLMMINMLMMVELVLLFQIHLLQGYSSGSPSLRVQQNLIMV